MSCIPIRSTELLLFCTIMACVSVVRAQNSGFSCPKITLAGPSRLLYFDKPETFSVVVRNGRRSNKLGFVWTASIGKIVGGQGTSKVIISVPGADEGALVTISVKVNGLVGGCADSVSDVWTVASLIHEGPDSDSPDEFGRVGRNETIARFDLLHMIFKRNPSSTLLVILQFDKSDSRRNKIARLRTIQDIFRMRKYDIHRVLFAVYEIMAPEKTRFMLIPRGADFPRIAEKYTLIRGNKFLTNINNLYSKTKLS
jgi:hypothetical protein